ncbi:hypothetical protein ACFSTH_19875 [Paenibacillus yanchengensis]
MQNYFYTWLRHTNLFRKSAPASDYFLYGFIIKLLQGELENTIENKKLAMTLLSIDDKT